MGYREMISNSLECDQLKDVSIIATQIESNIFDMYGDTSTKYLSLIRSRILNLRDKRNSWLRLAIINAEISPDQFVRMKSEELAYSDLREERKNIQEQAIRDQQLPKNTDTKTRRFKCRHCGGWDTSYNFVQTNMNDDEPLTTFCSL